MAVYTVNIYWWWCINYYCVPMNIFLYVSMYLCIYVSMHMCILVCTPSSPQKVYILQRGVQWKHGVVIGMVLCTILLYNATPIHCTPLPLHPPLQSIQVVKVAIYYYCYYIIIIIIIDNVTVIRTYKQYYNRVSRRGAPTRGRRLPDGARDRLLYVYMYIYIYRERERDL